MPIMSERITFQHTPTGDIAPNPPLAQPLVVVAVAQAESVKSETSMALFYLS